MNDEILKDDKILKQIEEEVIKNAENETDDMFIDKQTYKTQYHQLHNDFSRCVYSYTYTLMHKGQPVCEVVSIDDSGHQDFELSLNGEPVRDLDNKTLNKIWKAFYRIFTRQQEIKNKIQQRKEKEEKEKKHMATRRTFFDNLDKELFGGGKPR